MSLDSNIDYNFRWEDLGDLEAGRPNLGAMIPVAVYRLMQYTMRDVLVRTLSAEVAGKLFREAGKVAGREFCRNVMDGSLRLNEFIAQFQEKLIQLGIGILRIEKSNIAKLDFVLTVSEDLDCSGLPLTGETVCDYDEGFIAGVLEEYTGMGFDVREIDCWATGERVCRFTVGPSERGGE